MQRVRQVMMAFVGTLMAGACWAAEEPASLPAGAATPDMSIAVWIDLEALTPESLDAARTVLAGTIIDDGERAEFVRRWDENLATYVEYRQPALQAGARRIVVMGRPGGGSPSTRPSEPNSEATKAPPSMMLVQTKPGADLQALTRTARHLAKLAGENGGAKVSADEHRLRKLTEDWACLEGPHVLAPGGDETTQATQVMVAALRSQKDTPLRIVLRMTDAQRQSLKEGMLGPAAMLLAGVQQPLLSLSSLAVGIRAGQEPKIDMHMRFNDEASASQFRTGLGQLVNTVTMMAQLAALGDDAGADATKRFNPQALRVMLSPLLMAQDGEVLTTTAGVDLLQKLKNLGVSWTESLARPSQNQNRLRP